MGETLIIVESPAKARTLKKFLGRRYRVMASMGHVRDLPKSEFGVDVENGFRPKYITIRGKGETIKELRNAVKRADRVLLASDPDREGEAIAWHLEELLQIDPKAPCRIEFNEITKEAVQKAVRHPRPIDENRVNAQQARRILDRLVGYKLSPFLWHKVKKGLSAGRVQTVATYLVVEREREIEAFVAEEYWTITAILRADGDTFPARLHKIGEERAVIPNQQKVKEVLRALEGASYRIFESVRREKAKNPPPPFTTSTLQQEANRRLNFSASRTMMIAQQLYEGLDIGKEGPVGLVTYIRTDSTRVADAARRDARGYIASRFGKTFVPPAPRLFEAKGKAQDAHEAIRPTSVARTPDLVKPFLTQEQYRLYELIWRRFVASQMAAAVYDTARVDIRAGDFTFRATGAALKFPGFLAVYGGKDEEDGEEGALPAALTALHEGEEVGLVRLEPQQHFTQPPPRYTEATLVRALEEKGIGRPSTYAPILDTIQRRGYVVRRGKFLVPTPLGTAVVDLLKQYFPNIVNVGFTAALEEKLDRIEEGELEWVGVLRDFYGPFREEVEKAENEAGRVQVEEEVADEVCEKCGRNMVVKMGKYGKFLACPGFPACRNTRPLLQETKFTCPRCGGPLVVRRTRKGKEFYGCRAYPVCDFILWDEPTEEKCPQCGGLVARKQGRRHQTYYCTNPACGYREQRSATGGE
ncbi:MAG: type I DNA topoisomerase [Desulfotomaculales bacterium]